MMHTLVWNAGRFAGPSYMYGGIPWLMGLVLLAIVAALVLSIIAIVRTSKFKKHEETASEALNIIGQRYAKGELTKEEYEAMKKDLQ